MMFDAMCRAAKAKLPELAAMLRYASLLDVDGSLEANAQEIDIANDFRVPWKATAVESTWDADGNPVPIAVVVERIGCVKSSAAMLAASLDDGVRVNAKAAFMPMSFDGMDARSRNGTSDCGIEAGDCFRWASTVRMPEPECNVTLWCGRVACSGGGATARMSIDVGACLIVEEWPGRPLIARPPSPREISWSRGDFWRAIRYATLSTRPSNWLVKRIPSRAERRLAARSKSDILPANARDRWLLITDAERGRVFHGEAATVAGGGQHGVAPHPRRAHYRHIGTNEDGSRRHTWVRACWVGSKEAEIRGARYRVELDL